MTRKRRSENWSARIHLKKFQPWCPISASVLRTWKSTTLSDRPSSISCERTSSGAVRNSSKNRLSKLSGTADSNTPDSLGSALINQCRREIGTKENENVGLENRSHSKRPGSSPFKPQSGQSSLRRPREAYADRMRRAHANSRRAKKDGCRLLDSRLSINRLSSEQSFDANRFKLMITVR